MQRCTGWNRDVARYGILVVFLVLSGFPAWAETVCTVNKGGADNSGVTCDGGENYLTIAECENQIPDTSTWGSGNPAGPYVCEITDTSTYTENVTINIAGTTDASTDYFMLRSGSSVRPNGVAGASSPTLNGALTILDNFTEIRDLEIDGGGTVADGVSVSSADEVYLTNLVVHDTTSDCVYGINGISIDSAVRIANLVAYDCPIGLHIESLSAGADNIDATCVHCTIDANTHAIQTNEKDINVISMNVSSSLLNGGTSSWNELGTATTNSGDYNMLSDADLDPPGSNNITNVTLVTSPGSCGTNCIVVSSTTNGSENYDLVNDASNDAIGGGNPQDMQAIDITNGFRTTQDVGAFGNVVTTSPFVLAIGDSQTHGLLSDSNYVQLLRTNLSGLITVVGCGGLTSQYFDDGWPFRNICNEIRPINTPWADWVDPQSSTSTTLVVLEGTNDAAFNVVRTTYESRIQAIADQAVSAGFERVLLIAPTNDNTKTVAQKLLLGEYRRAVKAVADGTTGVSYAFNAFDGLDVDADMTLSHPDDSGHQKIANALLDYLAPVAYGRGNPVLP